jgi:hypothetical protein
MTSGSSAVPPTRRTAATKTPEATVSAMLAVGFKPGGSFTRVDKGIYTLADAVLAKLLLPGREGERCNTLVSLPLSGDCESGCRDGERGAAGSGRPRCAYARRRSDGRHGSSLSQGARQT